MKRVVICSSVTFYPKLPALQHAFEEVGLEVTIPKMARKFHAEITAEETKLLLNTESVSPAPKRDFIEDYFTEIAAGDLVLAYNAPKHNIPGYIGPNVLMELTVGFYLKKKLFVWEAIDPQVHGAEELRAIEVIALNQDPKNILKYL